MAFASRFDGKGTFRLQECSTRAPKGIEKKEGEALAADLGKKLDEIEDLAYFAGEESVLIVLQGMDTSGKDGTIRFLFDHMNALGVRVASFKVPTPQELAHDFLWRVHQQTPGMGEIVVFNRSHYEDVLVVRVHELVSEETWRGRYDRIVDFEKLLSSSKTHVLKFFLHISKEEQEKRLLEREEEIEKAWKLSVGDWKEREHWDAYQQAYEDAIQKTSTTECPWYVIPADQKWFRNLAIAEAIVERLSPRLDTWKSSLKELGEKRREELEAYRAQK